MQKTIHYRKVHWFGKNENLSELVKHVLNNRPNVADTQFFVGSETCQIRHRSIADFEVRLHISMHVPGARKPIIPNAGVTANADLSEANAPPDSEFTERELAIVVRDDCVGYVVGGRARSSTVRNALASFIALDHGTEVGGRLNLAAQANQEAIKRLLEKGVSKLNLSLSLPHANAVDVIDHQPVTISRAIGKAVAKSVSERLHDEYSDNVIDELAKMNVGLTINVGRKAPEGEIEALTAIAAEAVEDDEEFTIKTRDNAKITRDELLLTSSYSQPGKVSYLSYVLAWSEASKFLNTV